MKRNFLIIISILISAILACNGLSKSEIATVKEAQATAFAEEEEENTREEATAAYFATEEAQIDATDEAYFATAEVETAVAEFYFATETSVPTPASSSITDTVTGTPPPIDITPTCTKAQVALPITATVRFPVPANAHIQQADDNSIAITFPVEDQNAFDTWMDFINDNFLSAVDSSYSTDTSGKNFDWQIGMYFPPDTQMTPMADGQTEFLYSPVPGENTPADDTTVTLPDVIEMPLPPEGTEPQYLDDGQVAINFSVNNKADFDGWVEFMSSNFISGGTSYNDPFTHGDLGFNFPKGTTIEITDTTWTITVPR